MQGCVPNRFAIVAVLLAGSTMAAYAQSDSAEISGRVTDATGALVTGAEVRLSDLAHGNAMSTKTNSAGIYVFPYVRPGQYSVSVQANGFRRVDLVALTANSTGATSSTYSTRPTTGHQTPYLDPFTTTNSLPGITLASFRAPRDYSRRRWILRRRRSTQHPDGASPGLLTLARRAADGPVQMLPPAYLFERNSRDIRQPFLSAHHQANYSITSIINRPLLRLHVDAQTAPPPSFPVKQP